MSLGSQYNNPLELLENAIDWSLEDRDLLAIRGRSHFSRPLRPLDQASQLFFEYLNYGLAIAGLAIVWLLRRRYRLKAQRRYQELLEKLMKPQILEAAKEGVRS